MLFTLAVVVGKLMPQGISSSQVNGLECFFFVFYEKVWLKVEELSLV